MTQTNTYPSPPSPPPHFLSQPTSTREATLMIETALFIHQNGSEVETALRGRSPAFSFLSPHHPLYAYLRYLVAMQPAEGWGGGDGVGGGEDKLKEKGGGDKDDDKRRHDDDNGDGGGDDDDDDNDEENDEERRGDRKGKEVNFTFAPKMKLELGGS